MPVPGYEGMYEVSDLGRVYSMPRLSHHGKRLKGRFIGGTVAANGYPVATLSNGGRSKTWTIHALVMLSFVGPPPPGLEIRHKNGMSTDCALSNLVYGTHQENVFDTIRHGNHHLASKTHCKRGHELSEENVYLKKNGSRECRTCARAYKQAWLAAKRARSLAPTD